MPLMVQAAPAQFLKAGSIYCDEREIQDLAEILDAKTDRQLKRAVGAAIYSGTCAPPTSGPMATTQLTKKQSPGKKDIVCFDFVEDDGSVADRRFCAEATAVTQPSQLRRSEEMALSKLFGMALVRQRPNAPRAVAF